ncbi:hypothetical protein MXB_2353 [Myxobolus squamalis]|nr:hypothetical protein MXB_2353 [Myxobolus squamalis]
MILIFEEICKSTMIPSIPILEESDILINEVFLSKFIIESHQQYFVERETLRTFLDSFDHVTHKWISKKIPPLCVYITKSENEGKLGLTDGISYFLRFQIVENIIGFIDSEIDINLIKPKLALFLKHVINTFNIDLVHVSF